jgi:apolipoprotein N-acyltransferase
MKFQGWRAHGVALIAGALAALAMPPLFWLPLAVLGIVAYVWLWDTAPGPKSALMRGWAWGFGHFAVGSYWIVEAFYVPPADYGPLGVPIVTGLAVVLGFFPGLAAAAARWLALRRPYLGGRYRRLVLLAVCWTAAEWLRGHVFTGYPWNPLGHVWALATALLQGASLFGVYGLGTFTFLVLAAPAAGWRAATGALAFTLLAGFGGQAVLNSTPAEGSSDQSGATLVRIVQPNVPQKEKWQASDVNEHVRRLIDMSRRDASARLAAVIWPETAVPFVVAGNSAALAVLADAAPPGGYLLTGAARAAGRIEDGVWNSLLAIDGNGMVRAHYDKVHLVPLGEYIPFHKQLAPVSGAIGRGSFEVGDGQVTIDLPGLPPFSPTICYEAIFPGAVTAPGERPAWLLNVTNDAWFGLSSGPYQHLTSARLRAIEEGLPMIRAANTGISAVIDPYGRLLASLDMERAGIIDHALPPARPATPYSRWGDWILLAVTLALAASIAIRPRSAARAA